MIEGVRNIKYTNRPIIGGVHHNRRKIAITFDAHSFAKIETLANSKNWSIARTVRYLSTVGLARQWDAP